MNDFFTTTDTTGTTKNIKRTYMLLHALFVFERNER